MELLKAAQAIQNAPATGTNQPADTKEISGDKEKPRARPSKLEFKRVNEMCVPCEGQVQLS